VVGGHTAKILFESAEFFMILSSLYRKITGHYVKKRQNKLPSIQTPNLSPFSIRNMKVLLLVFSCIIIYLFAKKNINFWTVPVY
jgi:hypothetical protein